LVHVVLYLRNGIPVFLGGNQLAVIINLNFFRKRFGVINLVILFIVKAYGKSLVPLEGSGYIGTVYTAGKERAHFYIADLVGFYGVCHDMVDFVHPFFQGLAVVCLKNRAPVTANGKIAFVEGKAV